MVLHLTYKHEDTKDIITFLNCSVVDFYSGKLIFDDHNYAMSVKAVLLEALNDIEGSIRGQFNCDMFLRGINTNNKRLSKMFPTGCSVFRDFDLGVILCGLRNVNAHARLSERDIAFLSKGFYFKKLSSLKRMSLNIKYFTDKQELTMGGLIASIMLFLREQSISNLCKKSRAFCLIAAGSTSITDGVSFVQNISHVDLELPIREQQGTSLISALFGEYESKTTKGENNGYTLAFGSNKNPTFMLNAFINENDALLTVKKNSLTKVFYEDDYNLQIIDMDEFIEIANLFPPFVIVDLLYKMGVTKFDKKKYKLINNNINSYSKLNYPKFYIDKSLDILLMPPSKSDFRIVSSVLTGSLIEIFLRFEEETYRIYDFEHEGYSKILAAFSLVGFSQELATDLITLRNMAMHGYVLDEFEIFNGVAYQYSFEFVISTLGKMLKELQEKNGKLLTYVQKDVDERLVGRLIGVKYKKIVDYSVDAFEGHPRFDPEDQSVKNKQLFVESSFFKTEDLNKLYVEYEPSAMITKLIIEGEKEIFYIYSKNQKQSDTLIHFLKGKGFDYMVDKEAQDGIIKTVYWKATR